MTHSGPSPMPQPDPSLAMLHIKLRRRTEENIAVHHPWKQLLGTASDDSRFLVIRALEVYVQIWCTSERSTMPDDRQGYVHAEARVANLLGTAEQDLEKGLSFIREVEKGSHMKADAVLRFRLDAIRALCELCYGRVEEMRAEAGQGGDEDEDEGQDEDQDAENGQEEGEGKGEHKEVDADARVTTNMIPKRRVMQDTESAKGLIGTVYRQIEPQFKTQLQLLVHRHKKAQSK